MGLISKYSDIIRNSLLPSKPSIKFRKQEATEKENRFGSAPVEPQYCVFVNLQNGERIECCPCCMRTFDEGNHEQMKKDSVQITCRRCGTHMKWVEQGGDRSFIIECLDCKKNDKKGGKIIVKGGATITGEGTIGI